eukprot:gene20676-27470_t
MLYRLMQQPTIISQADKRISELPSLDPDGPADGKIAAQSEHWKQILDDQQIVEGSSSAMLHHYKLPKGVSSLQELVISRMDTLVNFLRSKYNHNLDPSWTVLSPYASPSYPRPQPMLQTKGAAAQGDGKGVGGGGLSRGGSRLQPWEEARKGGLGSKVLSTTPSIFTQSITRGRRTARRARIRHNFTAFMKWLKSADAKLSSTSSATLAMLAEPLPRSQTRTDPTSMHGISTATTVPHMSSNKVQDPTPSKLKRVLPLDQVITADTPEATTNGKHTPAMSLGPSHRGFVATGTAQHQLQPQGILYSGVPGGQNNLPMGVRQPASMHLAPPAALQASSASGLEHSTLLMPQAPRIPQDSPYYVLASTGYGQEGHHYYGMASGPMVGGGSHSTHPVTMVSLPPRPTPPIQSLPSNDPRLVYSSGPPQPAWSTGEPAYQIQPMQQTRGGHLVSQHGGDRQQVGTMDMPAASSARGPGVHESHHPQAHLLAAPSPGQQKDGYKDLTHPRSISTEISASHHYSSPLLSLQGQGTRPPGHQSTCTSDPPGQQYICTSDPPGQQSTYSLDPPGQQYICTSDPPGRQYICTSGPPGHQLGALQSGPHIIPSPSPPIWSLCSPAPVSPHLPYSVSGGGGLGGGGGGVPPRGRQPAPQSAPPHIHPWVHPEGVPVVSRGEGVPSSTPSPCTQSPGVPQGQHWVHPSGRYAVPTALPTGANLPQHMRHSPALPSGGYSVPTALSSGGDLPQHVRHSPALPSPYSELVRQAPQQQADGWGASHGETVMRDQRGCYVLVSPSNPPIMEYLKDLGGLPGPQAGGCF